MKLRVTKKGIRFTATDLETGFSADDDRQDVAVHKLEAAISERSVEAHSDTSKHDSNNEHHVN